MNPGLRLMLLLGCAMLVLLEAPRCGLVLIEDLSGPYPHSEPSLESAALDAPEELPEAWEEPTQR
jgi:hypothetical protein